MASLQAYQSVRTRSKPLARQRRSPEKQKQKRTPAPCADGFLKQSFAPITDKKLPSAKEILAMEKDFFGSLKHLSCLYGFDPLEVKDIVFPYNIYLAHGHAETILSGIDGSLRLIIVKDESHICTLTTVTSLESGLTLFYVPVEPLYKKIGDKTKKTVADLMLSVYACLYQVIQMSFYDASFIGYNYDMIYDWIQESPDEWEPEDYKEKLSDIRNLNRQAKRLKNHISKPIHLEKFGKRIQSFNPSDNRENELERVATRLYELWKQYPDRSFTDSIQYNLIYPEIDNRILPDQYFSFYWSSEGWLHEDLMENVNMSLQEMGCADDPVSLQFFDTPQTKATHDLYFETTLLDIICELADALNDF
jgi:hypothetical protein